MNEEFLKWWNTHQFFYPFMTQELAYELFESIYRSLKSEE